MTIKDIAKRIPDDVRSQLIFQNENIIHKAISVKDNEFMKILLKIWYKFVEPSEEIPNCPICIANVLSNFKKMNDVLIDLENEYQLLKKL